MSKKSSYVFLDSVGPIATGMFTKKDAKDCADKLSTKLGRAIVFVKGEVSDISLVASDGCWGCTDAFVVVGCPVHNPVG